MSIARFSLSFLLLLFVTACQIEEEPAGTPVGTGSSSAAPATATVSSPPEPTAEPATATATADAGSTSASEQSSAANADVTFVRAVQAADGTWTFHVTVEHPDTGWEDYANGWDVVTPDGNVVTQDAGDDFTRLLLHPHVEEQPFTRSQSGLELPPGISEVTIRAHDLVDGFGGREIIVDLTAESGPGFEVERREE